jgi:peptidoglycan/xylan/chitin deacetylase (PgdA/CDA1 family)
MQNGIIAFGAHSCTHPWLSKASEQKIREEVHNSKVNLEWELGSAIRSFSYPHGDYDDRVIAIVKEDGFDGACTTNTGLNTFQTSIFALRRTEIRGNFSLWRFLWAVYSGA